MFPCRHLFKEEVKIDNNNNKRINITLFNNKDLNA